MKKFMKKFIEVVIFIFDKRGSVNLGLCDYSGQGRDKYGR
jgi:hypothetical protein